MHISHLLPLLACLGASAAQYLSEGPFQRRSYYDEEDLDLGSLYARSNDLYDGGFASSLDTFLTRREASMMALHNEIYDQFVRRAGSSGGSGRKSGYSTTGAVGGTSGGNSPKTHFDQSTPVSRQGLSDALKKVPPPRDWSANQVIGQKRKRE